MPVLRSLRSLESLDFKAERLKPSDRAGGRSLSVSAANLQVRPFIVVVQRLKRLVSRVYEAVVVCACASHIENFSRFSR